jgi:hypothetical protein
MMVPLLTGGSSHRWDPIEPLFGVRFTSGTFGFRFTSGTVGFGVGFAFGGLSRFFEGRLSSTTGGPAFAFFFLAACK